MQSNLRNMMVVLSVITLVAAAAVGGVYLLTQEPIAAAKAAKTSAAIAEVLPEFDNDPGAEAEIRQIDGVDVKVYPAKKGGQTVGYAIETFSNNGFGGTIKLMVGFDAAGKIKKISVLEQKETPGLGDKILPEKSDFSVQFEGSDPATMKLSVKKDGGDVDAITASTITSRAYADAVAKAYTLWCALNGAAKPEAVSGATATGQTTYADTTSTQTTQEVTEPIETQATSGATTAYPDGASGATAKPE